MKVLSVHYIPTDSGIEQRKLVVYANSPLALKLADKIAREIPTLTPSLPMWNRVMALSLLFTKNPELLSAARKALKFLPGARRSKIRLDDRMVCVDAALVIFERAEREREKEQEKFDKLSMPMVEFIATLNNICIRDIKEREEK